jgi:hypothetical protein
MAAWHLGDNAMRTGNGTIAAQLAEMVAGLDRRGTETTIALRELIDSGARHGTGCQYAGITPAGRGAAVTSAVATHRYPRSWMRSRISTAKDRASRRTGATT